MSEAWSTTPIARDEDMPFGQHLDFPRMETERTRYIQAVSYELEFPPFRWAKDQIAELLTRKVSE